MILSGKNMGVGDAWSVMPAGALGEIGASTFGTTGFISRQSQRAPTVNRTGMMFRFERRGRHVPKTGVRPDLVVVLGGLQPAEDGPRDELGPIVPSECEVKAGQMLL